MLNDVELVEVRLLDLPLDLYRQTTQRHEELMREFALIALDNSADSDVPERLLELIDTVRARFSRFSEPTRLELEEAAAAGRDTIDVTFEVPPAVADAIPELAKHLDEADEFCRSGELLTLERPEECKRFVDWYLGEFIRQIGGEEPRPWSQPQD